MWRSLIVAASALCGGIASASAQVAENIEDCGFTFPVASYVARVSGLDIELPANDRLLVNGRVLAEHNGRRSTSSPLAWRNSSNTAEIAIGRREVIVRTGGTDCIDYQWTRIYVLNESGALRAAFTYPHVWERAVLGYRGDDIVYVSNYSCENSDGAPEGQAWTHVLHAGAQDFVREALPKTEVCSGNDAKSPGLLLFFMPMQPVAPR